ncbi:glycoside hydrolase family 32 protein [Natronococcus wangiae]|uniref:glycoside hydrolase family 32 protein n=1 Tax=Natronococcus wangiae TaxID=3068275 RepID=UPI00273F64DC|nr:glycoside hydrolase family 32 protein [Natronococcus sp. AD5]
MVQNNHSQSEGESLKESSTLNRRNLMRTTGSGLLATTALGSTSLNVSATDAAEQIEGSEEDPWRPGFHFAPPQGWINDPNGLVYHDGIYHLFFQYHPHDPWWEDIQWGHATSRDLFNWTYHGIKLPFDDENNIAKFSGAATVDKENTAGFGEEALILSYTGAHFDDPIQDQRIAYSTDNGKTVTPYDGNPVVDTNDPEFRDPNVFWYEPDQRWIMVVSRVYDGDDDGEERPAGIEIYSSKDHINWTYESTFTIAEYKETVAGIETDDGVYDDGVDIWECPDLFELPIEGTDETKWVLTVSVGNTQDGHDNPREDHLIGDFDGHEFTMEDRMIADYGYDYYAAISWDNEPDDRRIQIGWAGHWPYMGIIPETGWRGSMSVPREVTLEEGNDYVELRQHPVAELEDLRQETLAELSSEMITPGRDPLDGTDAEGRSLEIRATIDPHTADEVGFRVREGANDESRITYYTDPDDSPVSDASPSEVPQLVFQRTDSSVDGPADDFFDEGQEDATSMPLEPREGGTIELQILVDRSVVEIFANDGNRTMTNLVFPDWDSTDVSLFAENGAARIENLVVYDLAPQPLDIELHEGSHEGSY